MSLGRYNVHTHSSCWKCQLQVASRSVKYHHWQDSTLELLISTILAESSTNTSYNDGLQARKLMMKQVFQQVLLN